MTFGARDAQGGRVWLDPLQLLAALKSRGGLVYATACLAIILITGIPLQAAAPTTVVSTDSAMVFWVAFGFLSPVLETWMLQDCLQEALSRRGAGLWKRVAISWAAFAFLRSSSLLTFFLVGGVQGFLYAATYAVWRTEGHHRAFAMTFFLHLLANNALAGVSLLIASAHA